MASCGLRILVFPETPRTWVARGLEHDLAAGGRTIESAIDTLLKIATAHVEYDQRHHHRPLSAFAAAPQLYWDAFARATPLSVPIEVRWSEGGAPSQVVAAILRQDPAIRRNRPMAQTA